MPHDKPEVRRIARQRLRLRTPERRAHDAAGIVERLKPLVGARATVMGYWALPSEPDLKSALAEWSEQGCRVCLPRVLGAELTAVQVKSFDHLNRSELGVHEPDPAHGTPLDPGEIDVVLVPGVAFSRDGGRLGRGAGYYDRFLARLNPTALKLGVAFSCQLFDTVPLEPHDVILDQVICETG